MSIEIKNFFDPATSTMTYVVHDPASLDAVVIDPVWDYDPAASKFSNKSSEAVLAYIQEMNLQPKMILETHVHADHVTGAQFFKERFPEAPLCIGERITVVQKIWRDLYGLDEKSTDVHGKVFDRLFKDNETVNAGTISFKVLFTPGHTPACASYLFDNALFCGDTLFMPDSGTGRCDFPGGSAKELYHSITAKIYSLPETTRIFVCHDYQPGGRQILCQTSVADEKSKNIQLTSTTTEEQYVEFRTKRDATLPTPKLLLPSLQINIRAGHLPESDAHGKRFLKIPILT
ncbi:MBL fold metallo-hydrolase [Bdellovibrio sp. SKB1291214]|uniref:MBL fold metallo-hydrolase n=1 Tax=Bdellovibrio sp. SKB1291214 TaxID=1732569 RepID=UPI000B51E281|nr:MBL fold metallo-hydrolase [Bdellovibrio sp. SKB1291214]UYL09395.1 MBL fold metallo-hydrolase [Bdellovibrio sp. SKB1291214]